MLKLLSRLYNAYRQKIRDEVKRERNAYEQRIQDLEKEFAEKLARLDEERRLLEEKTESQHVENLPQ